MKGLRHFLYLTLLAFLLISASASATYAQEEGPCLTCKRKFLCTECVGSNEGGNNCESSCSGCSYSEDCGDLETAISKCNVPRSWLVIDDLTIREIAQVHPGFAASLALMNAKGGLANSQEIRWLVGNITIKEVEELIVAKGDMSRLHWRNKWSPVERRLHFHSIEVKTLPGDNDAVVALRTEKSDRSPASAFISVRKEGLSKDSDLRWAVTKWEVNKDSTRRFFLSQVH
jgi:hypothetical protein